jgi:hypothetical protein
MKMITLVAGDSGYGRIIKNRSGKNGPVLFLTESQDDRGDNAKKDSGDSIVWNKRSSLSARNSVLTVLNRHRKIDNAFIIYQPGNFNKTFHEISSPVYDLQIDRWIKGYGYLMKELIQLYIKQQSGRVSFILDTGGLKIMTPIESAIFSYLKALVQNLSILYQNETFRIYCFESDSSRKDDFADFIFRTLDDSKYSPGKNWKFTDKKGLFDFAKK